MSEPAVLQLDADALQRLRDLDPGGKSRLLERVLTAFVTSTARLGAQLAEARRQADLDGIRQVVHTLKSSSASVGGLTLSRLCAEIEAAIRAESLTGLDERLDAVDREMACVLQAVRPLAGIGPGSADGGIS